MALSILDGNQTATTLSTVVSSGQHIPAHTVVSLGATAISNIASAVSGVQVGGTVTANTNFERQDEWQTLGQSDKFSWIGYGVKNGGPSDPVEIWEGVSTKNPLPVSGTVTANGGDFASNNTTQPASSIQLGFQNTGGDFIAVNQDGASFPIRLNEVEPNVNVPISGTVTANVGAIARDITGEEINRLPVEPYLGSENGNNSGFGYNIAINRNDGGIGIVGESTPLPISGTVTASVSPASTASVTTFGSISSAQIVGSNASRKVITIFNSSSSVLYVLAGTTTASSNNYSFAIGEKEILSLSNITCALQGIYASSGTAFVTELT